MPLEGSSSANQFQNWAGLSLFGREDGRTTACPTIECGGPDEFIEGLKVRVDASVRSTRAPHESSSTSKQEMAGLQEVIATTGKEEPTVRVHVYQQGLEGLLPTAREFRASQATELDGQLKIKQRAAETANDSITTIDASVEELKRHKSLSSALHCFDSSDTGSKSDRAVAVDDLVRSLSIQSLRDTPCSARSDLLHTAGVGKGKKTASHRIRNPDHKDWAIIEGVLTPSRKSKAVQKKDEAVKQASTSDFAGVLRHNRGDDAADKDTPSPAGSGRSTHSLVGSSRSTSSRSSEGSGSGVVHVKVPKIKIRAAQACPSSAKPPPISPVPKLLTGHTGCLSTKPAKRNSVNKMHEHKPLARVMIEHKTLSSGKDVLFHSWHPKKGAKTIPSFSGVSEPTKSIPLLTEASFLDKKDCSYWTTNDFCGRNDIYDGLDTPRNKVEANIYVAQTSLVPGLNAEMHTSPA